MITPYKGRELHPKQRISVYKNLNNGLFSIKDPKSGLVVAHGENFVVVNGEPFVSETGRQRVLDSGVKGVHAWIKGYYGGEADKWPDGVWDVEAYYDPFKTKVFINKETGESIGKEDFLFRDGKAFVLDIKE